MGSSVSIFFSQKKLRSSCTILQLPKEYICIYPPQMQLHWPISIQQSMLCKTDRMRNKRHSFQSKNLPSQRRPSILQCFYTYQEKLITKYWLKIIIAKVFLSQSASTIDKLSICLMTANSHSNSKWKSIFTLLLLLQLQAMSNLLWINVMNLSLLLRLLKIIKTLLTKTLKLRNKSLIVWSMKT